MNLSLASKLASIVTGTSVRLSVIALAFSLACLVVSPDPPQLENTFQSDICLCMAMHEPLQPSFLFTWTV